MTGPLLTLALAACSGAAAPRPVAQSTEGMVVTGSALATEAGAEILGRGGNAVDAAVAAAFVLAVVEPTMSGLGGRTQIVLRTATGDLVGIDGGTEVPAGFPPDAPVDDDAYGYLTVGVPGTVAALVTAAREHGSLPWREVVEPARRLAAEGFPLPAAEAARLANVADRLREFPGSRQHFLDADGRPHQAGTVFRQPALARVLEAVRDSGAALFYTGWIADSLVAEMARAGGYVARDDLSAFSARPVRVVRGEYRGLELFGTDLPASGITSIEALQILEQLDVDADVDSPAWLEAVGRALLASFEDRVRPFTSSSERVATLTSPVWAARRADEIASGAVAAPDPDAESPNTTHLSVADGRGGLVALTQSVGPTMGSKVASPALGFVYAATMGYLPDLTPGDRPFTSMSPLIVMEEGEPVLVLGAAGARRIISAVVTVVSRYADGGMSLETAMRGPRFHPTTASWYLEARDAASWTGSLPGHLRRAGLEPVERDDAPYFARLHAIHYDRATGTFTGVADPRWNGSASGPR